MTHAVSEERFRQAAEAEGGSPVSAGARMSHVRMAVEAGRVFYVDLSSVPENERPAVIAEIKALVDRAGAAPPDVKLDPSRPPISVNS
jgi:hypothetical protein